MHPGGPCPAGIRRCGGGTKPPLPDLSTPTVTAGAPADSITYMYVTGL